jgi:hypothetical protein
MLSNNVCEQSLTASGEPAPSALKDSAKPMELPLSDPISDWLDRASSGHARMETDSEFRAQIERLIAQQLLPTLDPAKR